VSEEVRGERREMERRPLGRTGWSVSPISFGAWAIGGSWGEVSDQQSLAALHRAVDLGVNFFDTADVYGDGRSEQLLGRLRRERSEELIIATKAGRRLDPHLADGYTLQNLTAFVERSLRNLSVDALDLLQLHCPPGEVYGRPEVFDALDRLEAAGKIRFYGVSVERVDEGLQALAYPRLQSIQVIYNLFRQRPAEQLLQEAERRRVGILARLPLSSGMLTGKLTRESQFSPEDHRAFNRKGESFDQGETFSGIDYLTQLDAVEELRPLLPPETSLAQLALRWILMQPAVTCAIPGAKTPLQVEENVSAASFPPLSPLLLEEIDSLYHRRIYPLVHHRW
jgi:aryl-alcohol dehydrogenase-like predicted oxidoreductase